MSLKNSIGLLVVMSCTVWLTSCEGNKSNFSDGIYEGQSIVNEEDTSYGNGYGVIEITISGGVITECTFETYNQDGTLKAEDYGKEGGKISNRDYYNMAQKAVASCEKYADQLVKGGSLKEVDAISGATVNYDLFREAAEDALKQAESK